MERVTEPPGTPTRFRKKVGLAPGRARPESSRDRSSSSGRAPRDQRRARPRARGVRGGHCRRPSGRRSPRRSSPPCASTSSSPAPTTRSPSTAATTSRRWSSSWSSAWRWASWSSGNAGAGHRHARGREVDQIRRVAELARAGPDGRLITVVAARDRGLLGAAGHGSSARPSRPPSRASGTTGDHPAHGDARPSPRSRATRSRFRSGAAGARSGGSSSSSPTTRPSSRRSRPPTARSRSRSSTSSVRSSARGRR